MLSRIVQCRHSSEAAACLKLYFNSARRLSQSTLANGDNHQQQQQALSQSSKPKLHWTEEFRIRSPKVPPGRLRHEPVVAIDIDSDAFYNRRIAFLLRRGVFYLPMQPRWRGVGKILSYCGLASLPYLVFCKWVGGTPLLGEMTTYAIPATVAAVCLGYLAGNLAIEKFYLANRIFSVALDENNPDIVYITTLPLGGWLHGQSKSYATLIDNIQVEPSGVSRNWSRLTFKSGGEGLELYLPTSRRKCFVVDSRAMSAFTSSAISSHSTKIAQSLPNQSDLKGFDQVSLPNEREIDRHLDESLSNSDQTNQSSESGVDKKQSSV